MHSVYFGSCPVQAAFARYRTQLMDFPQFLKCVLNKCTSYAERVNYVAACGGPGVIHLDGVSYGMRLSFGELVCTHIYLSNEEYLKLQELGSSDYIRPTLAQVVARVTEDVETVRTCVWIDAAIAARSAWCAPPP